MSESVTEAVRWASSQQPAPFPGDMRDILWKCLEDARKDSIFTRTSLRYFFEDTSLPLHSPTNYNVFCFMPAKTKKNNEYRPINRLLFTTITELIENVEYGPTTLLFRGSSSKNWKSRKCAWLYVRLRKENQHYKQQLCGCASISARRHVAKYCVNSLAL